MTGETANGKSIRVSRIFFPQNWNFVRHQAAATPNTKLKGTAIPAAKRVNRIEAKAVGDLTKIEIENVVNQKQVLHTWYALMGVIMGLALGMVLCWVISNFKIVELPADIYYLSRVPVDVRPWDVVAVTGMGLLLSLLATLYPASRAAKADPVEAIHYG